MVKAVSILPFARARGLRRPALRGEGLARAAGRPAEPALGVLVHRRAGDRARRVGIALLARRCLRGQSPVWVLPLLVFAWTIAEFLFRPAITPHQPWASRRMVPAVLPGLILLAVWLPPGLAGGRGSSASRACRRFSSGCRGSAWPRAAARPRGAGRHDDVRPWRQKRLAGIPADRRGLAYKRTYDGEITAVDEICAAIPADSSVLIIDRTMMLQLGGHPGDVRRADGGRDE